MKADRCQSCDAPLVTNSGISLCPACMLREVLDSDAGGTPDDISDVAQFPSQDGLGGNEPFMEAGRFVSHFEILERVGSGGMGVVYKARDRDLGRTVALKFLPSWLGADVTAKERFIREARAASALDHVNIATVHEVGETADAQCFIAMAYYDGRTLAKEIADGPLPADQAVGIAAQLADGLACAHEHGVVHRDVKPGNVMITPGGVVKLLDFGLAKLSDASVITRPGTTGGTAAYMSPEQARGDPVDHRTDIWSLGIVLFEMLTGRRPFAGDNAAAVVNAVLREPPPPIRTICPELPVSLCDLVDRCLEKDPAQRPATMEDVHAQLCADQFGVGLMRRIRGFLRSARHRRARAVTMAAAAVIAAGLGVAWFVRHFTVVGAPRIQSIAVLPFRNLAGQPEQEYFAKGMQEALIGELAKIGSLRVISQQSTLHFVDSKLTIPEIARQLHVTAIVTASVLRDQENVHLSVHLIEALPTERERWTHAFTDTMANVLTMHRDVARSIASEIRVNLSAEDEERFAHTRTITPASYEAYLKGMYHLNKWGPEDHKLAMTYFEQAVESNPADPYAYVGLAHGYLTLGHGPEEDFDPLGKARAALDRALRLDPTIADAQTALAEIKLYNDWDLPGFEATSAVALKLNPSSAMMHYHTAWYFVLKGDFERALAEHNRARELDPLTPFFSAWIPAVYMSFGRFQEALARASEIGREFPNNPVILFTQGVCEAQLGRFDRAIECHEKLVSLNRNWKWALGCTYALAGRTEDARRIQAEWVTMPVTPWNAQGRAVLAANLGDLDEAFRWLEHRPAHDMVEFAGRLPLFAPMWSDPRFAAFLERHHLPPLLKDLHPAENDRS